MDSILLMNLLASFALALCSVILKGSNINDDLYSRPDFGCSQLTKLINKYSANAEDFMPPASLLKDSYTVNGDDRAYWLPESGDNMLFDVVDLKKILVPVISEKHPEYRHFFIYALLAQYIIPSWLKKSNLTARDTSLIRLLAPFITTSLRRYFQHVAWAVYFQTGQVGRQYSELMSTLHIHMSNLGFNMRHLTLIALNTPHYRKLADYAPSWNVLAVAMHWNMDLKVISKAMRFKPGKDDADRLKNKDSGPSSREALQSILPRGSSLVRYCHEAEVADWLLRFPRDAVNAIVVNSSEDFEMASKKCSHAMVTRGQKRKAEARPSQPPKKRPCHNATLEIPVIPAATADSGIPSADKSMPSIEDVKVFSEFIERVHYEHLMLGQNSCHNHLDHNQAMLSTEPPMPLKMRFEQRASYDTADEAQVP